MMAEGQLAASYKLGCDLGLPYITDCFLGDVRALTDSEDAQDSAVYIRQFYGCIIKMGGIAHKVQHRVQVSRYCKQCNDDHLGIAQIKGRPLHLIERSDGSSCRSNKN